jgi:uncharacterized radical SAM superfamily protein
MMPALTPDDLIQMAEVIAERGGRGFLLSGGVDSNGRLSLSDYIPAVQTIKETTDLKINAHIGLCPENEIPGLVRSGIDAFSVDVYGCDETIREVLGLDARADDYLRVVEGLVRNGAPLVAPHICIGIHGGHLKGEQQAVEKLRSLAPRVLILLSLIPTKGTPYASVPPPSKDDVLSIVHYAKENLPTAKLVLGCMRSKLDRSSEAELVAAGLDGIVLPANSTVEKLRAEGYTIRKSAMCCSFA